MKIRLFRRQFLDALGVFLSLPVLQYMPMTADAEPPATSPGAEKEEWISTLKPVEIKDGDIRVEWMKVHNFILSRVGDQVLALDISCTHRGCPVAVAVDSKGFVCHCHGAEYDRAGVVTKGPAKASLARHPLRVNAERLIEVDVRHTLPASDPQAVLLLP